MHYRTERENVSIKVNSLNSFSFTSLNKYHLRKKHLTNIYHLRAKYIMLYFNLDQSIKFTYLVFMRSVLRSYFSLTRDAVLGKQIAYAHAYTRTPQIYIPCLGLRKRQNVNTWVLHVCPVNIDVKGKLQCNFLRIRLSRRTKKTWRL